MLIILNCVLFDCLPIAAYNKLKGLLIWEPIVTAFEQF